MTESLLCKCDDYYSLQVNCIEYHITNKDFEDPLGKGSFGIVYKATRQSDNAFFAIKLIKKQGLSEENLKRECAILEAVSAVVKSNQNMCMHLLHIEAKCEDSDNLYIVTPFMDAKDLNSYINYQIYVTKKKLEEDIIIEIIRQFLTGFRYVSQFNIIHRDLKPGNLFLRTKNAGERNGNKSSKFPYILYIGDFGESKISTDIANTRGRGTGQLMAPEVMKSNCYGPAADVYSIGCIIYKLVNNEYFQPNEISTKQTYFDVENKYDCSEFLSYVIEGCIQIDPKKRLSAEKLFKLFNVYNEAESSNPCFSYAPYDRIDTNKILSRTKFSRTHYFELDRLHNNYLIYTSTAILDLLKEYAVFIDAQTNVTIHHQQINNGANIESIRIIPKTTRKAISSKNIKTCLPIENNTPKLLIKDVHYKKGGNNAPTLTQSALFQSIVIGSPFCKAKLYDIITKDHSYSAFKRLFFDIFTNKTWFVNDNSIFFY